jgi:hypothetical protein
MDRVTAVLRYQWRAYWRRFRRATSLTRHNAGILVVFGGIAVFKFLQQLPLVAKQLANGQTSRYQTLLTLGFLVWMMPPLAESKRSISSRGLLRFPLSNHELFAIRLGSLFFSPVTWIIGVVSLALLYPLAMAAHPFTGTLALFAFVLVALFSGLTLAHVLNNAFMRKLAFAVLLLLTAAAGLLWFSKQTQIIRNLPELMPHQLAAGAAASPAPIRALVVLVVMLIGVAFLSWWTFKFTLQPRQDRRAQSVSLLSSIQLPGRFGGLLKKDLRYLSRLLDVYLTLPVVILFNIYLASNDAPSATAFWIIVPVLFLPCTSIVFNSFGLDEPLGLDRYALFPLSAKEKLASKNIAFAVVMAALFATILPLALLKMETWVVLVGCVELVLVGLAYASYGNCLSVKLPFKMQFYRFASGGSAVDAVMGMIFGSVPAAALIYLLYRQSFVVVSIVLLLAIDVAIYVLSLRWAARVFDDDREVIRHALS